MLLPPPRPSILAAPQAALPAPAKAAFDQAYEDLKGRRLPEAIQGYERALALAPDSWDIWLEYTSALRQAGSLQKAARAGWRTVELGPGQVQSWINLSNVLLQANSLPEDFELLQEMTRRFPGDPGVVKGFDNLGYAAWCREDYPLAQKALTRTLQLAPGHLVAQVDLAGTMLSAGAPDARARLEAAHAAAVKAGDKAAASWAQTLLDESKGKALEAPYPEAWAAENLPAVLRTQPAQGMAVALPIEEPLPRLFMIKRLGSIRIGKPAAWMESLAGSDAAEGMVNLTYRPSQGSSFTIKITAIAPAESSPRELKPEAARGILESSLRANGGGEAHWIQEPRGAMVWVRDPNWKPGNPDDFPYLLSAIIQVGPLVVTVSCFTTEASKEPPKAFLDLVASLAWVPRA